MTKLSTKSLNKAKGSIGESLAVKYIKKHLKYKIIETNYSCMLGEIDIIAKDKNTYVFIEVKYRESASFGMPREAVTPYKQNKIRKVAISYLKLHSLYDEVDIRFDVVDILCEEITYIDNAF